MVCGYWRTTLLSGSSRSHTICLRRVRRTGSSTGPGLRARVFSGECLWLEVFCAGKFGSEEQVRGSDHRARLDAAKLPDRLPIARKVEESARQYAGGITRLALHFSLSPSAVSCIIPGARNQEQMDENVRASGGSLSASWRERIDKILNSGRNRETL